MTPRRSWACGPGPTPWPTWYGATGPRPGPARETRSTPRTSLSTSGSRATADSARTIIGVIDPDGRPAANYLDVCAGAGMFGDPVVGSVQIQARMLTGATGGHSR